MWWVEYVPNAIVVETVKRGGGSRRSARQTTDDRRRTTERGKLKINPPTINLRRTLRECKIVEALRGGMRVKKQEISGLCLVRIGEIINFKIDKLVAHPK